MGNTVVERYIPVSRVHDMLVSGNEDGSHPVLCPECQNDSVLLEGRWIRRYKQAVIEGVRQNEQLENVLLQDVTAILCPACAIRFLVIPDDQYEQKRENMELRTRLSELEQALDPASTFLADKPTVQ